ncbi:hypothetical protein [Streptomyces iranensis]|uniref:hypothetical protein n=1 Tax=Streptomyces iranensis TaxID=576784 RepID=UPI00355717F1
MLTRLRRTHPEITIVWADRAYAGTLVRRWVRAAGRQCAAPEPSNQHVIATRCVRPATVHPGARLWRSNTQKERPASVPPGRSRRPTSPGSAPGGARPPVGGPVLSTSPDPYRMAEVELAGDKVHRRTRAPAGAVVERAARALEDLTTAAVAVSLGVVDLASRLGRAALPADARADARTGDRGGGFATTPPLCRSAARGGRRWDRRRLNGRGVQH